MLSTTPYSSSPSGLILPTPIAEKRARMGRRPKAMDFFAGCGGMSLGTMQAGVEVVAAVEWDIHAAMTYALNLCRYGQFTMHFVTPDDERRMSAQLEKEYRRAGLTVRDGHVVADGKLARTAPTIAGSGWISGQDRSVPGVSHLFVGDVRKLTSERILKTLRMEPGDLDIIMGGPPCQGYSKAGKQNISDPRNNLVYEFARFIREIQPRSFVMEEVPEVAKMMDPDGVPVLEKFKRLIEPAGYDGYEAFKKVAHGAPNRAGALRGASVKKLETEAKRERRQTARAADASRAAPAPVRQPDLFG